MHTACQAAAKLQIVLVSLPPACKAERVSLFSTYGAITPGEKVRFKCFGGDACPHRKGVVAPEGGEFAEISGEAKDEEDARLLSHAASFAALEDLHANFYRR